jgi:Tol biopolymer transport system component/tRNA A-37 threonylcarbamoyl transferase component Bud32
MSITPGSRIGPYEVTSQLGEGAMGVVFRARDTKLLRDVALKVLPDHFADDPGRLSRLQREAQLLASLNHPNIAQVYGLEQVGNSGCIVMELVDGETLAEKLKNGPLPFDEVTAIAKQIADALAAAHERGIVHRDLKPANIKLTPNGTVKVLDFGLAKALTEPHVEPNLSSLPTKVSGTIPGGIVGTIGYMSPEQARGKEVDARSDIWAFGCVLYEMLTGKLAFHGETATDMLAKIVTGQPDLDLLPPGVPVPIRLLLTATLNKNSQQRLQHIGDARLFLDESLLPHALTAAESNAAIPASYGKLSIASFVAGLAIALIAAALYIRSSVSPAPGPMQFEFALPDYAAAVSVSPDGQHVAYIAQPPDDNRAIWIRSVGSEKAQKLAGTDKVSAGVLWSPDSSHVAFIAEGKLKKIEVASGALQTLCEGVGQTIGFSWAGNTIIYTSKNAVVRVSADGGTPAPVTTLDTNLKETLHAFPVFLPDGNHFIYLIGTSIPTGEIFLGTLDGKTKTKLMSLSGRISGLAYAAPGYVLIGGDSLTAQRFDTSKFSLEGTPFPIVSGIDNFWSVSNTGLLFYRKVSMTSANKQLTWFDRAGRQVGQVGAPNNYLDVELSPNGDRVAVDIVTNNNRDVWTIDVARGVPSRITFDPASDWSPAWSPDGSRIAFASSRNNTNHIYEKSATGVGNEDLVFQSDSNEIPVHWSHDGKHMVFSRLKPQGQSGVDTWVLELSGQPRKASPFVESPFDKAEARISPDGRWLAYTTNDSGTYQVVVQTFPDPNGGKWSISAQGGIEPKWSHDGHELYYLAFDGKMMAVPLKTERGFEAGAPMALFETPLTVNRSQTPRDRRYDVAPDGRFLIAVPAGAPMPISAVVDWASGLEKK